MFRVSRAWPSAVALGLSLCIALPAGAAEVELLSRIPPRLATETANGGSRAVALSADGRFLVFLSSATNLVAGVADANRGDDVFLYDRATGETVLVSQSTGPEPATANQASQAPAISADGRFVAFSSGASDLVPGQAGEAGLENVFLWDRVSGVVELVSHTPGSGSQAADGQSFLPSLSADGRYVAFQSHAGDLVNGLVNRNGSLPDVFLYDRRSAGIVLVSRSAGSAGKTANSGSVEPVISADGRFVAFRSRATDLVSGQKDLNRAEDFFLWDRTTGRTVLVSHAAADRATAANGLSLDRPFVSADGAFVAFLSRARNLVPGQSGLGTNVFLWARATGAVALVTHAPSSSTRSVGAFSNLAGLSADGSWVLFNSTSRTLVPGQIEETEAASFDVFLWSRQSEQIRLLSGAGGSSTRTGNGDSFGTGLSADGSWVALASRATNLVPGVLDSGPYQDIFLWSRRAERVELLSHTAGSPGTGGGGESSAPLISADGRVLAYTSYAPDLDPETRDANADADVVLESRSGTREIVTRHAPGLASATPQGASLVASIDASGRWVTFLSNASALFPEQIDTNGSDDVFLYDRATRKKILVSHAAGFPQQAGNAGCSNARISADGRFVALLCRARDLVPGQTGDNLPDISQLFLWSRETDVMTLVSHAPGSPLRESNGTVYEVAVSADGSVLAFSSAASNLVPGQIEPQPAPDVFAWERATDTVSLLSGKAGSPTETGNSSSFNLRMSADGRIVAFESHATDLVAGVTDSNNGSDVFVHDRASRTATLLSRAVDRAEAVGGLSPRVSANGRFVAFGSSSPRIVAGQVDSGESPDLFLWDREAGATRLVSHTAQGPTSAAGGVSAEQVDLDADGRFVAFASASGTAGTGVFLFDRESGATVLVSQAAETPRISADGRLLVFASTAGDSAGPQSRNLFLYDRTTGAVSLVTHAFSSPSRRSDGDTVFHVLAASGSAVAFTSLATDLVTRDFNNQMDAFATDLP